MKTFKREMVRLLVEYTGRPELFKKIKWTDGNPLMASLIHLGWKPDEINGASKNDLHLNDAVAGNYSYMEDIIFIKTPTETRNNICLHYDTFALTLNTILHEVAHRVQYSNGYKHSKDKIHGKEFQEACLELGLVPSIEAHDTDKYIEHDKDVKDFYEWAGSEGTKHFIAAHEEKLGIDTGWVSE